MNSPAVEDSSNTPAISVVIPTFNRPDELRLCLESFGQQTIKQDRFEVIVVDDGSTVNAASYAGAGVKNLCFIHSEHAGAGMARNIAIKRARAPLLVLYDDDLRPLPDLVEYCLHFHRLHPAEQDMALLRFGPDPAIGGSAFAEWAFGRLYPFPQAAGTGGWGHFWSGTTTVKKSLFRYGLFDPAYQMAEDTELALRLSRSVNLRVRFEPRLTGTLTRRVTLDQICRRQYTLGYFCHVLADQYRDIVTFSHPPYNDPELYVISNRDRLTAMIASARGLEAEQLKLNGNSSTKASKLLDALWSAAELHARAEGWLAARDHQPLQPPGTLGLVL
jgi:glycosyltransferase involved in cell wall biosynthesis